MPFRVALVPALVVWNNRRKAKEDGIEYKVGKFPFAASGKAVAVNHSKVL